MPVYTEKQIARKLVDKLLKGKCPIIKFQHSYAFRRELLNQGLLKEISPNWSPVATSELHNLAFIINHGREKTKETFEAGNYQCRSEPI